MSRLYKRIKSVGQSVPPPHLPEATMNCLMILSTLLLAATVLAVPSGRAYENEQALDSPQNHFILRWTVDRAANSIEMEWQVNCTGWIGIAFSTGTIFVNATGDIIMGGYNDTTKLPYIEVRFRKQICS